MRGLEEHEYRKTLLASAALHLALAGVMLATARFSSPRLAGEIPGPMNVMWAESVHAPAETAPNKLPGPEVPVEAPLPPKTEKPKFTAPEKKTKPAKSEKKISPEKMDKTADDARRRKQMADAVAALRRGIDSRPIPRADNFPSKGGKAEGLPSGPGGAAGILGGSPELAGYKARIRQVIFSNIVWIQPQRDLKTEVTLTLDTEGNILSPAITKPSGNAAFDNAVLRAVRKSSPLPTPPAEVAQTLAGQQIVITYSPQMK